MDECVSFLPYLVASGFGVIAGGITGRYRRGRALSNTKNWGEEGWAWVDEVCEMLECGEGKEYEIRERIKALKN